MTRFVPTLTLSAVALASISAYGSDDSLPRLSVATGATLASCTDLATRISFANTSITAANAIGFEMRLPNAWNGRFTAARAWPAHAVPATQSP
ncbi:MAG: hypothetical protein ABI702_11830 [Burkholderiales bacterium]